MPDQHQGSRLSRRQFLALAAAASLTACRSRTPTRAATAPEPSPARVLPAREWATLEAATARILPSDDGPGAREAGVITFIDRQLTTPELAAAAGVFLRGARALDEWAAQSHGRDFAALAAVEQDALLTRLSLGELPQSGLPQELFFRALHGLTLEGFLSDPIHGGNAGQIGWRTIGFPEPALRTPGGVPCHEPAK